MSIGPIVPNRGFKGHFIDKKTGVPKRSGFKVDTLGKYTSDKYANKENFFKPDKNGNLQLREGVKSRLEFLEDKGKGLDKNNIFQEEITSLINQLDHLTKSEGLTLSKDDKDFMNDLKKEFFFDTGNNGTLQLKQWVKARLEFLENKGKGLGKDSTYQKEITSLINQLDHLAYSEDLTLSTNDIDFLVTFKTFTFKGEDYKGVKLLGIGASGTVYLVEKGNKHYAAKVIPEEIIRAEGQKILKEETDPEIHLKEGMKLIRNEVDTQQSLDHPNITKCMGMEENNGVIILMEVLPGDLFNHGKKLTDTQFKALKTQLGGGLKYMHQQGKSQGDIKSDNVLCDFKDLENPTFKWTDFGFSGTFGEESGGLYGTPQYLAPETFSKGILDFRTVDLFAFGVLLMEAKTGDEHEVNITNMIGVSNTQKNLQAATKERLNGMNIPESDPDRILILGLLDNDPQKRIEAFEKVFGPLHPEDQKPQWEDL